MKINTKAYGRFVWTALTLSAVFTAGSPLHAQVNRVNPVAGKWEVSTKANRAEKRIVSFNRKNGQLIGFYTRKDGRKEPITGAKFANKTLSFQVPTVHLAFRNVKFVGTNLEGDVVDGNPGKMRSIPQAVRLTRVSN